MGGGFISRLSTRPDNYALTYREHLLVTASTSVITGDSAPRRTTSARRHVTTSTAIRAAGAPRTAIETPAVDTNAPALDSLTVNSAQHIGHPLHHTLAPVLDGQQTRAQRQGQEGRRESGQAPHGGNEE